MPQSDHQRSDNDATYVVVARRYRPLGFEELVGQEHVGRALKNAIETNRVGHAYLFTGARGVGKTSTARIFAKALNDPGGPTTTPDNTSDVAQAIDAGEDVDVIEIDGASNRGIDEIRTLRANVGVRPSRSRFKIYIIDEVHMLTGAAFNALLKTLEEPPEHVKFIFCTTDPEKIPITVLSRCQRFDFAPVEVPKIVARLREIVTAESADADDAALELIARRAAGSMRDSQSLLEQVLSFSDGKLTADHVHAMLGTADDERLHSLARAMADREAAEALTQMDAAIDAGVDAGRLAEQLLGYFRDLMAVCVGCDASMLRHASASLYDELQQLGGRWGLQTVLAVVGLLDQTLVRIRHSIHDRVLLEAALIQICYLPDLQHLADLAAAAGPDGKSSPVEKKKQPVTLPQRAENQRAENQRAENQRAETVPRTGQSSSTPKASDTSAQMPSAVTPVGARQTLPSAEAPSAASFEHASAVAVMEPVTMTDSPHDSNVGVESRWDQPAAERSWQRALEGLESMTESIARVVHSVKAVGERKLRLVFPADANLAMQRCQLPEHCAMLTDAVSAAAGRTILLEFIAAAPEPEPSKPIEMVQKPSRVQRMREIESNELIQSCVELFDAEIVRIDKPK